MDVKTVEKSDGILRQLDHERFRGRLEQELSELDESQRSTFVMRYYEELSIKEIATAMNCSEGTVKSRLFYTLKKLAGRLYEFDPKKQTGHGR